MDQPKIERLLQLIALLSRNTSHTIEDIGRILDISPRTVYRYIDTFKAAGFAINKSGNNIYTMVSMPVELPDLENIVYFSKEEAFIVKTLIENLSPTNALKENLKAKLSAIYDQTAIADIVTNKNNAAKIEILRSAIKEKQKVILSDYASGNSQTIRDRFIEPISFTPDFADICAYDLEADKNKVFKISRIGEVRILDEEWSAESKHRPIKMDVFRMSGQSGIRVKLDMSILAHNLLVEEFPLSQRDIKRKGQRFVLDTIVYSFLGIGRFYMGLIPEIQIIDSPEFEDYVRDYINQSILPIV